MARFDPKSGIADETSILTTSGLLSCSPEEEEKRFSSHEGQVVRSACALLPGFPPHSS